MKEIIFDKSKEIFNELVGIRRKIHSNPELAFNEFETSKTIALVLDKYNIKYKDKVAKTGIIARINDIKEAPTILIRADMDALPIKEETNADYASINDGIMHACGHDVHIASVLGAGIILNSIKDKLNANIILVFQPAEEGVGGALPMINEGHFSNVNYCLGMHVDPSIDINNVLVQKGPVMAGVCDFSILIKGKGGHGAYPHQCIDPIVVSASFINSVQSIVSRNIPHYEQAVVTIGSINGGSFNNIIPNEVKLLGTLRSLNEKTNDLLVKLLKQHLKNVCSAYGASYELIFTPLYKPTVNDDDFTSFCFNESQKVLGSDKVINNKPCSMGGEDFCYFAELAPSCYIKFGTRYEEKNIVFDLHNSKFNVDENVLHTAPNLISNIVYRLSQTK